MDKKQQTAVDWLFKKLWDTPKDKLDWYVILAQAKEIEKEQIMDSYNQGSYDMADKVYNPEQYYTQTYERNRDNKAL